MPVRRHDRQEWCGGAIPVALTPLSLIMAAPSMIRSTSGLSPRISRPWCRCDHGTSRGRAVPDSRPLPHAPAPVFRAIGRVSPAPNGRRGGRVGTTTECRGWVGGRPRRGPRAVRTRPHVPPACAPCGDPDPPPTGDHRPGSRRAHPHDRRDRDTSCRGTAHVPGPLTKAVSKGFDNGTTASRVAPGRDELVRNRPGPAPGTAVRPATIFVACTQPGRPRRRGRARHRTDCE
jgi:hypothetical protein